MPPNDNFIARGRTQEQISEIMKMPVFYISIEGMLRAFEKVGIPREDLCTYCIGGKHPFQELASSKPRGHIERVPRISEVKVF
jgi:glutamine phosphoribosylpyrophosphate amidotransferase